MLIDHGATSMIGVASGPARSRPFEERDSDADLFAKLKGAQNERRQGLVSISGFGTARHIRASASRGNDGSDTSRNGQEWNSAIGDGRCRV
jgi:hypothetical protein